jgi:hypothetical protein
MRDGGDMGECIIHGNCCLDFMERNIEKILEERGKT